MKVNLRILIVDDDVSVRESLAAFLEDDGFEVYSVESAEDALRIMKDKMFDAAVVDLRLPAMDGSEFIRQAYQSWPDVCYLIFTGSACYELPQDLKALTCVANTVYQKPLRDLNILSEAIRQMTAAKEGSDG